MVMLGQISMETGPLATYNEDPYRFHKLSLEFRLDLIGNIE